VAVARPGRIRAWFPSSLWNPGPRGGDSDPERLLKQLSESNRGGDVHLVGGPRTIETFRSLGALDKLGLIVLPLLVGEGMRLTPSLSTHTRLELESEQSLPGGPVEIVYAVSKDVSGAGG
jgi:dihydrofolate reductase